VVAAVKQPRGQFRAALHVTGSGSGRITGSTFRQHAIALHKGDHAVPTAAGKASQGQWAARRRGPFRSGRGLCVGEAERHPNGQLGAG
jgi:hypothetical protein